ncbi:hypothetical protein ABTF53_19795, partial [Acinetobacter baumannii]
SIVDQGGDEETRDALRIVTTSDFASPRHTPRPVFAKASPGQKGWARRSFGEGGKRGIQYAAAYRFKRWRLWNTGSPAFAKAG